MVGIEGRRRGRVGEDQPEEGVERDAVGTTLRRQIRGGRDRYDGEQDTEEQGVDVDLVTRLRARQAVAAGEVRGLVVVPDVLLEKLVPVHRGAGQPCARALQAATPAAPWMIVS